MNPYDVVLKPLLTEKTNGLRELNGQYAFEVKKDASKTDVKKALESLFEVKVTNVSTSITRGKLKRRGQQISRLPNKKKAIVTLAEGQTLSIFEDN